MKKIFKLFMSFGVITGLLLETFPVWALTKDESIYAKLDNNGQVNKVIVSEHLQGTGDKETTDKTKLEDIENINGDEKFTNENGKLVWESNGKDIYYQGKTKEELPISLNISYYFNGEETKIADMLGKKGTVKMVLKFTNNDKHEELINGKYETIYTPFVVATTTILSNTKNSNIKVTNGKVITNGTSSIVVLLSTPGLYESLGIDKLKGMDTAEITFDTDSFELSSIYSVSTPKLIDKSDLDIFNNIDGLYTSINTLVNSSNQIKSGSGQLLQGANQLKEGVSKLKEGINSAYNGSKLITDTVSRSINNLQNDTSPAITNEKLAYIKSQFSAGAKQTATNEFDNAKKAEIATEAWTEVQSQMDPKDPEVVALVTTAITNAVTTYLSGKGLLADYQTCEASDHTDAACLNIDYDALAAVKTAAEATALSVANHVAENVSKGVSVKVAQETAVKTAEKTAGSVSEQVATLIATQAKETATTTTIESLQTLLNGLSSLTNGLNEINNRMIDLDTGTSTLRDGISSLDSGISQFNSQGINKISDLVNGDVKSLEGKLKALGKLSLNYGTFDDKENGTEGSTKIIMVVDEIKSNSTTINKVDKIADNKESLWEQIKELIKKEKSR